MKNVIMQVTYFLNIPMVNLLFYCHILIESVFLIRENLAAILLSHNAFDGSIQMLKNS